MNRDIYAKISQGGERFWIEDIEQIGPGLFRGRVANDLVNGEIDLGDEIEFEADEIIEIATERELLIAAQGLNRKWA